MIAARMWRESGCSPRPDQCEGKWKALTLAFRKCEDHNSKTGNDRRECPFYKELSDVYGYRPNVRPYATASSSGHGDSTRRPETPEKSDDENNEESSPATRKRHSDAAGSSSTPQKTPKKPRLGSGKRNKNECLSWLKEYAEEKRTEQEARRERAEQHHREKMELLSGLLNVLKDFKKWTHALEKRISTVLCRWICDMICTSFNRYICHKMLQIFSSSVFVFPEKLCELFIYLTRNKM